MVALRYYLHNDDLSKEETAIHHPQMGRSHKKATLLEGSGEGNEKFPSPPFLSPVSFPRKEIGPHPRRVPARRAQTPPGLAGCAAFGIYSLCCTDRKYTPAQ